MIDDTVMVSTPIRFSRPMNRSSLASFAALRTSTTIDSVVESAKYTVMVTGAGKSMPLESVTTNPTRVGALPKAFAEKLIDAKPGSNGSQLPIVRLFPVAPLPSSEASSASTELPRLTERISVDPLAIVIPGWGRPSKFSTNSVAAGKVLSAVER